MANMKSFGFTFTEFDQWAADAGCTCKREPRWNQPPASNQSDRPGWAIINLAAKFYGLREDPTGPAYPRRRSWSQPTDRAQPVVRDRTVDRRAHPDPRLRIRPPREPEPAWWQWIGGCRWSLLSTNSHTIADRLHARQFTLAARLKADGNEEAANMVGITGHGPPQLAATVNPSGPASAPPAPAPWHYRRTTW